MKEGEAEGRGMRKRRRGDDGQEEKGLGKEGYCILGKDGVTRQGEEWGQGEEERKGEDTRKKEER